MAYSQQHVPKWNTISISGYHVREAGSDAVQEVAFTLANAITYVKAAIQSGLAVDDFAPRISFFFNAHNNLLEEVAKFRAARRMWARIMKEKFGAKSDRSCQLRFHAQTAGSTLTAQQPQVNIPRVTLQALAAVLGGTQSLHTNAWDEALALPSESSALLALRTQQIIANESGVTATADPLAGSYYIESTTNIIEKKATGYLDRIEAMGGMLKAIEAGYVQKEIQESAYRYARALEEQKALVVGVNVFRQEEEPIREILQIDLRVEREQIARLEALRKRRDAKKATVALRTLEQTVVDGGNIMEPLIEALESYVTLGEVSDLLRRHFGEYREASIV
jgi:methylmalonyl-CoA mutase N-terminal domain/subunit